MRKYLIAISILLSSVAYAQTEILSGVTRGKDYGVLYTLPKTEINIEVKVNKVVYTPGEFSRYADRYLRLNNVSGDPEEYWELVSVSAQAVGIPDSENTYFIKLKDKTVAPLVELTEDGLIASINVPATPKTKTASISQTPASKPINPRDFFTEEILMANSTAKMAELVSKEIYYIRESRNALVRGQADTMPTDGAQLKLMLEKLDIQERAMLEMFSGVTKKEERTYTIKLTPNKEFSNEVAFRFSRRLGVLDKNNLAGDPIYFNLKNQHSITIPPATDEKSKKLEGVAYNVPGKANATIMYGKDKVFDGDLLITQFGIIEYLAPALFNKNSTIKVWFNPESGSLKKVERE
ncbi:DUF4831 family protein [Bacteroides sp. 224]|uniref:DUF4831 family protein n=1 Tax=Bacteroides sp. 224 TaxID=2302936 RepID=UPI0013D3AC6F|nr:DUF4831 family protein [Bacteroides sp. 224]NDV65437.1 DUF4831 family protein [Bacteroides sp. 224]